MLIARTKTNAIIYIFFPEQPHPTTSSSEAWVPGLPSLYLMRRLSRSKFNFLALSKLTVSPSRRDRLM